MAIHRLQSNVWELEPEGSMKVPVRLYATKELLDSMKGDRTLEQIKNVASMQNVISPVSLMPDAHQGYGFPIGGVAAFPADNGLVSPGGIGYDINCGMRVLRTGLTVDEVRPGLEGLVSRIFDAVPSGVGSEGAFSTDRDEFKEIITQGIEWAVSEGYASKEDRARIEEKGCMETSFESVSQKALSRGLTQVGTLGAGNHFIEIQEIDNVFNDTAKKFGLKSGEVTVMIHTGSRGFGHQIATDHIRRIKSRTGDGNLAAAPLDSKDGRDYIQAMRCAVNFAFVNRQMITHHVRDVFRDRLGADLELLYGVAHNIGKFEDHGRKVFVHRKGAIRAFGPGRPGLGEYRSTGQPVILPGSMGTHSYVLVGKGNRDTFESACHGAGRTMSRTAAKKGFRGSDVRRRLGSRGIFVRADRNSVLAEEAPGAYKDISEIIRVVQKTGMADPVARLKPLGVIKG